MAKPSQGRFDGVYGMRKSTADELFDLADQYEACITAPSNTDDPMSVVGIPALGLRLP